MSVPKDIRHHLAKAKGYLQKMDTPLALESIAMALREMSSQHLRCVPSVEKEINAILRHMAQIPPLSNLLDPMGSGTPHVLAYQYGKEGALGTVLREFAKILREQSVKNQESQRTHNRLQDLLEKGNALLEDGQLGTGAAFLQRAASEYPQNPQHIADIGHILLHYKQYAVAGKVFMASLAHHPKMKDFYSNAIEAYILAEKYAAAELIFLKAFQQFGRHPRSLAKLAELYLMWDKEDEAEEIAQEALTLDAQEAIAHKVLLAIEASVPKPEPVSATGEPLELMQSATAPHEEMTLETSTEHISTEHINADAAESTAAPQEDILPLKNAAPLKSAQDEEDVTPVKKTQENIFLQLSPLPGDDDDTKDILNHTTDS